MIYINEIGLFELKYYIKLTKKILSSCISYNANANAIFLITLLTNSYINYFLI